MVSSEKVDSGRFSSRRSNFSQTCSLLSQYLKEKGSFGDLSLSLTPNFAEPIGMVQKNYLSFLGCLIYELLDLVLDLLFCLPPIF